MGTYGYISCIALFCYIFMLLLMLAARRNRIANSFLILLIGMICWTGGSLLMRNLIWPGYVFWYHVSLFGLFALPLGYYRFITEFAGKPKMGGCIFYGLFYLLLFVFNVPGGFFLAPPELLDHNGTVSFVYHMNWHTILLFLAGGFTVIHVLSVLLYFSRKNRTMGKQFQPIVVGIFFLFAGQLALLIPAFEGFPIDILGGLVNACLIMYALMRRRLFQLRLLASEGLCYGVGLLLNFVLYFNLSPYITEAMNKILPQTSSYYSLVFSICFLGTAMVLALVWREIMKNVFVKEELQQAEDLKNFSSAVSKSLCVRDILEEIVRVIQRTVEVEGIYICIQQTNGDYRTEHSDRPLNDLSFFMKKDNPLVRWLKSREGILMKEFRTTVEYKAMWEEEKNQLQEKKVEACIGLKDGDQLVGVLLLGEKKGKKKLDNNDLKLLNSIASVASIAIKNARLYEQAYHEARTDELTGLLNRKYFTEVLNEEFEKNKEGSLALIIINLDDFKLYNQLYGTRQGDQALKRVADIIRASVGANGYVARYTGKEFAILLPKYDVYAARGLTEAIQKQIFNMNRDSADCKLKVLTISAGISAAPYAARNVKELLENVDMAVYHVKRNGKNGIKVFDTLVQEELSGKEGKSDHEHIYQEYESTIYALTAAIDTKDHYTFQHSKNVAYYATELAKALHLNPDVIEVIRQAALLHDVGKIGIPETILNKPAKLTDEEYEVIKGHVEASIGIIRHLPSLDYVIPAVIGHHERYDGKGYPRRIAGEDIPLTARILCVADSFDAMTSRRCYKAGIPLERVLKILREEEGHQFDPKLARTFEELIENGTIRVVKESGV